MCNRLGHEELAEMIELNLLEKKQPFKLPDILGVDLNVLNFKMLIIATILFYVPEIYLKSYFEEQIANESTNLQNMTDESLRITSEINRDSNVKTQLEAYNAQVEKLKSRSSQVDEILKIKTNPKKILEKIARSIPEDLWFDKLSINYDKELLISGGAFSARDIGDFITIVNDSPFFGNSITPTKQENRKEMMDGVSTSYEYFEIKGKIKNFDMRSR
jgi:Tfp pilus assembly protein PilN